MYPRRELCRNFQRGSCQFGDRCKFLHPAQQQQKPNPFGFGAQNVSNPQQKPNPFGFGVQNKSHSRGSNSMGNKQNQFKAFENKWIRQPDSQPQPADHKCTDPESCKRIINEDFNNERPLWKLTCYGHRKYGPCDISGDTSYEELRATAYDDAKRGLSMQSIVERERSLLNSKLVEFDNLLRNPYKGPANSVPLNQSTIFGSSPGGFAPMGQNSAFQMVPGFGQNFQPVNTSFGPRTSAPQNNLLVQPSSFASLGHSTNGSGINSSSSTNSGFSGFQSQVPTFGSSSPSYKAGFDNFKSNPFNAPAPSPFNPHSSSSLMDLNASLSFNTAEKESANVQLGINPQNQNASGDISIWLKQEWSPGEIPEEAPPDSVI